MMMTKQSIVKLLKDLERGWPTGEMMIFCDGNAVRLCSKHPQDGGKVIESFDIPNDGGDPDWQEMEER